MKNPTKHRTGDHRIARNGDTMHSLKIEMMSAQNHFKRSHEHRDVIAAALRTAEAIASESRQRRSNIECRMDIWFRKFPKK
jgi:hypothetical protein